MAADAVREKPHRGWTSAEQFQFLDARKDGYIKMKSAKGKERIKLKNAFWPPLYEAWFERWPLVIHGDLQGKHSDEETTKVFSAARLQMETVSASA